MKLRSILSSSVAAVVLVSSLVSCKSRPANTTLVQGINLPKTADSVVVFENRVKIASAAIKDGKFSMYIPTDSSKLASIFIKGLRSRNFIPDGSDLMLDAKSKDAHIVSSVPKSPNNLINNFTKSLAPTIDLINKIQKEAATTPKEKMDSLKTQYMNAMDKIKEMGQDFVKTNINSVASLVIMQELPCVNDSLFMILLPKMNKFIQNTKYVKERVKEINNLKKTAVGQHFTDFTIKDSDGKTVKFSDYVGKGKYMLVDFWASWCGPCRGEIPNIKKVWKKYHGKNFDVLSVAVWDKPENSKMVAKKLGVCWNEIINAQEIPSKIYGFNSIPQIMLFGPDGTILARDLRGEEIGKTVASHLKNAKKHHRK